MQRVQFVIVMKESIKTTENMEVECSNGLVATFTKASTRKMKGMDTAKCIGMMAVVIKVNG